MKNVTKAALAACAIALSGCSSLGSGEYGVSNYWPVGVRRVSVGDGSLSVAAPRPYNRQRSLAYANVPQVEDWTLNGPYLDGISFVSGLKNNKVLVYQRRSDNQQVPPFRSNMTPPEIAEMLESLFRVRGGALEFHTLSIQPRQFVGYPGFQFDYEHLDSDELWRKGRAVGAVIDGRLYLILMDAARSHYYNVMLPDFEAIVASARLRTS